MNKAKWIMVILGTAAVLVVSGCSTTPKTQHSRNVLSAEVDEAIAVFKEEDPEIQRFFDRAYGFAVFPKVYKGAFWVGGAHGKGEVFEQGELVGYASLSQATLGFSFGGQYFREIIFFETQEEFNEFRTDDYTFAAQATATFLKAGAASKADYERGMAVFVIAETGLMVDASIGGQKFNYVPEALAVAE